MENRRKTSIPTIVLVVFVILKLTGNVSWPWWIVLSPLWGGAVVLFIILLFIGILMAFDHDNNS
jgi:hypothetical protein